MTDKEMPSTSRSKRKSSSSLAPKANKLLRLNDPSFKDVLDQVLLESEQCDSDGDIDDCFIHEENSGKNHVSDQEMAEDSIISNSVRSSDGESSDDDAPLTQLRTKYYYGKNRYKWATKPPSRRVRTAQHNIVVSTRSIEQLTEDEKKDPISIWNKLFDSEMRQTILTWTNFKIAQLRAHFKRQERPELKDIDMIELNAFLGLLYYAAILKSDHAATSFLFATDGTGSEIFRCCVSETRFLVLLTCLRFDNPADRSERLKTDKLAAISGIFTAFVANSQKLYNVSEYVTIDEMLVEFRGMTHMVMYMPQKPGKYGLLIRALCDAKTFYFYNGYLYSGKGCDGAGLSDDEKKFLVPTQCVLRLTQPLQGTNRNVTADNRFSSVELVDELSKRKLTYVGTVKKNKREIPNEFQPHKSREIGSTLFGFTNDKTLCSHVPKENKAVLLVSSMHHSNTIDDNATKPEMILFYNATKGGVDETDKKCSIYSSSRQTRRWPMVVFYRILDLCGINAYILHNQHQHRGLDRGKFLKELARSLVVPQMQRRVMNSRLPNELTLTIKRVLGPDMPNPEVPETIVSKRRTCTLGPPKIKRKTTYTCVGCGQPICLQCSKPQCKNCQ